MKQLQNVVMWLIMFLVAVGQPPLDGRPVVADMRPLAERK